MEKLKAQVDNEIDRVYANKETKEIQPVHAKTTESASRRVQKDDNDGADSARLNLNEDLFGLDTLEVPDQAMPPINDEDDEISEKEYEKEEEPEAQAQEAKEVAVDGGEDSSSVGSFGDEADNTSESAEDDLDEFGDSEGGFGAEADQALPDDLVQVEPAVKPKKNLLSASKYTEATKAHEDVDDLNSRDSSFELMDEADNSSEEDDAGAVVIKRRNSEPALLAAA